MVFSTYWAKVLRTIDRQTADACEVLAIGRFDNIGVRLFKVQHQILLHLSFGIEIRRRYIVTDRTSPIECVVEIPNPVSGMSFVHVVDPRRAIFEILQIRHTFFRNADIWSYVCVNMRSINVSHEL